MKILKSTNVYLTTETEVWVEPIENNVTHFTLTTRMRGGMKIESLLSSLEFPKAMLKYQIRKMCEKLDIPFLPQCIVGGWGYKKALKLLVI